MLRLLCCFLHNDNKDLNHEILLYGSDLQRLRLWGREHTAGWDNGGEKLCVEAEYFHFYYSRTRDDHGETNQDCFAEL